MPGKLKVAATAAPGVLAPLLLQLFYSNSELYCFCYPGMVTRYALGFSEPGFNQVSTVKTMRAIQKTIGDPLHLQTLSYDAFWSCTLDGKCVLDERKPADFAWLWGQIHFWEGKVVEIVSQVCYD